MLSKCRLFEKAVRLKEIGSFIFSLNGELGWSNGHFIVKDNGLFEDYFGSFLLEKIFGEQDKVYSLYSSYQRVIILGEDKTDPNSIKRILNPCLDKKFL